MSRGEFEACWRHALPVSRPTVVEAARDATEGWDRRVGRALEQRDLAPWRPGGACDCKRCARRAAEAAEAAGYAAAEVAVVAMTWPRPLDRALWSGQAGRAAR